LRTGLLYILMLINSWSFAQVDTLTLHGIPTKKCEVNSFPVKWEEIDFQPPTQNLTSSITDIKPVPYSTLKTTYIGKPEFEKFFPEDVIVKKLSRKNERDNATLDIQYLNKKHGLPTSLVYNIERDHEGSILFTSEITLNSYDGHYLTSYYFNDSIGSIRNISARNQQKNWISSTSGVYYQLDGSFYRLKNNWGTSFWRAIEDQEGILWMTSFNKGVYYIKNDSLFHMINEDIKIDSKEIIRDHKGQVWLACVPGVIRMSDKDTVLYHMTPATRQACSIIEFEKEIYVGLFRKGMYKISGDEVWNLELDNGPFSPLDFEITEQGLWFAIYGRGLQLITPEGSLYKFYEQDGLVSRGAHSLTSDNFGNIWVGDLFAGISIFSEANFIPNKSIPRLHKIYAAHEIKDTSWYFYSHGEPIRKIGDRFFQMKFDPRMALEGFHEDGSFINGDKLWIQASHRGLIHYDNNRAISYEYTDDPQDKGNHQLSLDKYNRLWTVNYRNELRYFTNDTIHLCYESVLNENACQNVNQLVIDSEQELYFSNQFELFWAQKESLYRHRFPGETIKYIFKNPTNGIWVFTNRGFHHLVKDKIIEFHEFKLSKKNSVIHALAEDENINLITSEGFLIFNLLEDQISINKISGNNDLFEARIFQLDNKLMISGRNFNHHFKPWWNLNKKYTPKFKINKIEIDGNLQSNQKQLKLKPNGKITFHINYQDWGKNTEFQYQLSRASQIVQWQTIDDNSLTFDNLSRGNYQLKLRAKNQSNKWIESQQKFEVVSFWYNSVWFFSLLGGLLVLGFYYIYKSRVIRAEKMETLLNAAVEEKTMELAEEKQQVEKQLQQKELLLKEVNHRVMNNMQMVSSILELQNGNTEDQEATENLNQARDRIKALALAHQHLYQNEAYETIKIKEYLSVIVLSLNQDNSVQIDLNIPKNLELTIDRAQSLGLILNELIANSLKHAWEGSDFDSNQFTKRIAAEIKELDQAYLWRYQDNGKGITSDQISNSGLGTTLIGALTERQLSGTLNYKFKKGLSIEIKFPKL